MSINIVTVYSYGYFKYTEKNTIKIFPAYLQLKEKGKADNKQVNTLTFAKYPPKGQRYIKALPFRSNALEVI